MNVHLVSDVERPKGAIIPHQLGDDPIFLVAKLKPHELGRRAHDNMELFLYT